MPKPGTPGLEVRRSAVHLRFDGVSFSFPGRRVVTDVSFTVPPAHCTGLIGENGSGKSTLLRLAAGLITPDAGTVSVGAHGGPRPRIGLLHQQPPFEASATVAQVIELAVAPARRSVAAVGRTATALAREIDNPALASAYQDALDAAVAQDVWATDARIEAMVRGLGLAHLPRERDVSRLSGGERSRLALASLLLNAPDVLLLDEPTNHLDDTATAHLAGTIAHWPGPVLLASHDRALLDESVASLVDVDPAVGLHSVGALAVGDPGSALGVTHFSGSYTDYLVHRRDALTRWERAYREEQAELTRLRDAVAGQQSVGNPDRPPRTEARSAVKFYADRNARVVSRRVTSARTRLQDLAQRQVRTPPQQVRFRGLNAADEYAGSARDSPPDSTRACAGVLLQASEVAVRDRLEPTSICLAAGESWLVTGVNGSGKSTLLAVLAGQLAPTSGALSWHTGVRVGLLAQDEPLADPHRRGPGRSVRQAYVDVVGAHRAEQVPLEVFGLLSGREEGHAIESVSLGQRRRLALAVVLADPPDILLLDEPTNHLSLALVTEIEAAIGDYPGAVLMASHDRWVRDGWSGPHLELS